MVGIGSLDNNALSVEKDQDKAKEVLIPMDEEAVTENIVFTTFEKIPMKTRKIWSKVTKKLVPMINNLQFCRSFRRFN